MLLVYLSLETDKSTYVVGKCLDSLLIGVRDFVFHYEECLNGSRVY